MRCSFCVVPYLCNGQHSPRHVDQVVDEIAGVQADHIYFCDDENFIDPEFALELAQAILRRGIKKRYFVWARATTVNRHPEVIEAWREAGLDAAFLGFEFPSDEELKLVKKASKTADNERAHDNLRKQSVAVHAAFMVMPEHEESDFERLRSFVAGMPPAQCSFTVCTPSPGTPSYQETKDRFWVKRPYELHDCMHPLTPTRLPLKRFAELYGRQVAEAAPKTPLRSQRCPVHLGDLARAMWATDRYIRAYRTLYRDYPADFCEA